MTFSRESLALAFGMGLCAMLMDQPSTVLAQGRQSTDQFAKMVTIAGTDDGEQRFEVHIPPALEKAIRAVVPQFRLRTAAELRYGGSASLNESAVAIAADLDGDGIREAVLWGRLVGSDSSEGPTMLRGDDGKLHPVETPGPPGVIQTSVLLGIRQTAAGFSVERLLTTRETLFSVYEDVKPSSSMGLSKARLLASGKTPRGKQKGSTRWIRWQDGDCKSEGSQWTVRNKKWIRSTSDCEYGE